MEELYYRFIERLRQDPAAFSRNRNFHTFDDPGFLFARRVHRRLLSLEQDLLRADPGEIVKKPHPKGVMLSITLSATHSRHVAFLSQQEYSLLLSNPEVRRRLEPAATQ